MRGITRGLATAVAVAMALSACAGDGDVPDGDEDTTTEPAAAPEDDEDDEDDGDTDPAPDDDVAAADDEDAAEAAAADLDLSAAVGESCADLAGYAEVDGTELTDTLIDSLAEPGGAFRADADLGPLTKAVLLLDANEGPLPRARYRVTYGTDLRDVPPAADPVTVGVVRIDRFNLGPRVHDQLVEEVGEEHVGAVEDFGTGPHVSYCLLTQALQGMAADAFDVARAEIPDELVDEVACLGASCSSLASVPEEATAWEDGDQLTLPDTVYDPLLDGAPGPAVALDLALTAAGAVTDDASTLRWHGFEDREGIDPGEPFVDVVIDAGLGQDSGVDLALREGHVMDHTVEVAWQRITTAGAGEATLLLHAHAVEARDGG